VNTATFWADTSETLHILHCNLTTDSSDAVKIYQILHRTLGHSPSQAVNLFILENYGKHILLM